ncbi:MAG TPA: hypothetical protein VFC63_12680 [Blastocatellia bacterium]|nr:hypothetical protein [Blastocatellia bacterium]
MNQPFLELLKQVANGVVIYEPFRRDAQGLNDFQDTVHRLQEMEKLGLIGKLFVEKRTRHGLEQIDFVMIQGGLTPEGQRLLTDTAGEPRSA